MDISIVKRRIPRKFHNNDDENDHTPPEETLESMAWESTSSLPTDAVPTPDSSENEDDDDDDDPEAWTGVRIRRQRPTAKIQDAITGIDNGLSSSSTEDIPTFLFSRATTALDNGSDKEAAMLLQLLIREDEAHSRATKAGVYVLLADAYVSTASQQTSSRETRLRTMLFNDAIEALNNAEKAADTTKLNRVKIKVKQCTLALAEGKKEEAERLICMAEVLLDKLVDGMKRSPKDSMSDDLREHKTPTRRQLKAAKIVSAEENNEEEENEGDKEEELQYLKVEIYTIKAMLLCDETDGRDRPQAQKELSGLIQDPIKLQLVKDILEGFGYELLPDSEKPSMHKIRYAQNTTSSQKRKKNKNSDGQASCTGHSFCDSALALALMLFMVYVFFLILNIIKLTAEGGLKTVVVFVLASCWSFALYLFLLPYVVAVVPGRN